MRIIGDLVVDSERSKELQSYKDNLDLFVGEHYEVFKKSLMARLKKSGYGISNNGFFTMQYTTDTSVRTVILDISLKELFVSENILGSAVKTFRNFLFGEMVEITTDNEVDNEFVSALIEDNDLYNNCLRGTINQSVNGFAAFRISKSEDEQSIVIDLIDNENITVNCDTKNKNKIDNIEISYCIEENGGEALHTETHYRGRIEYHKYEVKSNKIIAEISSEEEQLPRIIETGINDFLVVLVNNELTDDLIGNSDFTESVINLQKSIDCRLTQQDMSLDKTQNPMMQLPASIVRQDFSTKEKFVDVVGKAIVGEAGETAKYIEYQGNYLEVEQIIDNRRKSLYNELQVVPALFDTEKLGNASGTALKIKLMPTLSAILMKKNQWEIGLKKLVKLSYKYLMNADMDKLSFKWYDGIPVDRREEAEISKIRTGGDKTQAVVSSIMEQDGKSEEDALKEYNRILEEEKQQQSTVASSFGTSNSEI